MERMPKHQLLLLAAYVLGLAATTDGTACDVRQTTLGGPCCPGAKVNDYCAPKCTGQGGGNGCRGYCKKDSSTHPLLKCAPCGLKQQPCCPSSTLFSPCVSKCGGFGCNAHGTCVGKGTGTQLTCRGCGGDYGQKCCPGQPPNSSCKPSVTNFETSVGYCHPKTGICTACNLTGGPCCPGTKPGDLCDFFGTCKGTGTGLQLTCD